jgi:hypothetical protein
MFVLISVGKHGGYHGFVTVYNDGSMLFSEVSPIEACTKYDARMDARYLAQDIHFQNGGTKEEWETRL